jgi:hypothetical protein
MSVHNLIVLLLIYYMIYLFESELPENKSVYFALKNEW